MGSPPCIAGSSLGSLVWVQHTGPGCAGPPVPGPSGGRRRPAVRPGRGTTARAGSRAGHQRNAPGRGRVQLAQRTISRNPAAFGAASVISAASPALPRGHAAAGPWLCRPLPLFGFLPSLSFPARTPLCPLPSLLLLRGPPGRSRDPAPVRRPAGMSRKQAAKARPAASARKGRRARHSPAGPAPGAAPGHSGGLAGQLRALGLKLREVPGDG